MKNGSLETDIYLWMIKNRLRYREIYSKIGTLPNSQLPEEKELMTVRSSTVFSLS